MPMIKQKRPFKVLVLMDTSVKSQREWLRGILDYSNLNGAWETHLKTGDINEPKAVVEPGNINYDGLIGSVVSEFYYNVLLHSKIPTLVIEPLEDIRDFPVENFHFLKSDTRSVGRKGAEFFLSRNWKNYAYLHAGMVREWSVLRGEGFAGKIEEEGFHCHIFKESFHERYYEKLNEWLRKLPKPAALMAANDFHGRLVIECCRNIGIKVPDELAVLGVDNDDLFCKSTSPTLSSMTMTRESAGFEGGALLDQMMRGQKLENKVSYFSFPGEIIERGSTAQPANSDPVIGAALEYIHLNLDVSFTVGDIADHLKLSRRTLELKFRKARNSSIRQEITRLRLEKVKFLLRKTDYTLAKIAFLSGFNNENYLAHVFRKEFNQTMVKYRQAWKKQDRAES